MVGRSGVQDEGCNYGVWFSSVSSWLQASHLTRLYQTTVKLSNRWGLREPLLLSSSWGVLLSCCHFVIYLQTYYIWTYLNKTCFEYGVLIASYVVVILYILISLVIPLVSSLSFSKRSHPGTPRSSSRSLRLLVIALRPSHRSCPLPSRVLVLVLLPKKNLSVQARQRPRVCRRLTLVQFLYLEQLYRGLPFGWGQL